MLVSEIENECFEKVEKWQNKEKTIVGGQADRN